MSDDRDRLPDDYLWHGEGPPDEDVRALETLLSPLRYHHDTHAVRRLVQGTGPRAPDVPSGMHEPAVPARAGTAGLSPTPHHAGGGASPSTSPVDSAHAPAPSAGPSSSSWRWLPLAAAAALLVWVILPRAPATKPAWPGGDEMTGGPRVPAPHAGGGPGAEPGTPSAADLPSSPGTGDRAPSGTGDRTGAGPGADPGDRTLAGASDPPSTDVADARPPARIPGDAVAAYAVDGIAGLTKVRAGSHFVADGGESAFLELGHVGGVRLAPGSYVSVVSTGDPVHRLALHAGGLEAKVGGQPERLEIETPGGRVVALGGSFSLDVAEDESTWLHVGYGDAWLVGAGRRVYVPQGTFARAWAKLGPTTPVHEDVDEMLARGIVSLHAELLELALEAAWGAGAGEPPDAAYAGDEPSKERWADDWRLVEALGELEGARSTITQFYLLDALATLDAQSGSRYRERTILAIVDAVPLPPTILLEELIASDEEALAAWEAWLRTTVWAPAR